MSKKYSTTFLRHVISENRKNLSNKLLSSVLGLALLATATQLSAQTGELATITCPSDITLECGQNLQDYDLTGLPTVQLFVGASYDLVSSDATLSSNDCTTVIARTWSAELNELGGSLGAVSCTQVITVVDTQAPVISGVPSNITVDCVDAVPAASTAVTAEDACSGSAPVSSFQSATGSVSSTCNLTTAFGPGADWSIWLMELAELGYVSSPYFHFQAPGASFEQFADNTARITGTLVNNVNPNQRFAVDLWFENKRNWNEWSNADGPGSRSYKNDLNLACIENNYQDWSYYELVAGFSTLTGEGDLSGDQLYLQHLPTNFYYGFQVGIGANNKNCNNGISGWFSFQGFMNNTYVDANGDINCDAACEPQESVCANRTSVTYLYRAEDACGRASIAEQTITVFDDEAPMFTNCPVNITIDCTDPIPALPNNIEAIDNCSGVVTVAFMSETPSGEGCTSSIERIWMAEDECGNRSFCTQIITITDSQAPVLSGTPDANVTAECDNVPAVASVSVSDNCDDSVVVNFTETTTPGSCIGDYTITRTWTAEDECGNETSFTQTISVVDSTAPVFDAFPVYIAAQCDETTPMPTATDNCSGVTISIYSEVLNSGGCIGVITRTYRAIDGCGNFADLVQFITLQDNTAPTLNNVPAETSLQCNEVNLGTNGNYFGVAPVTASDNCDESVDITYSEQVIATDDNCEASFDIIRTWIATDDCENADTASQVIHIIDTTNPWFASLPETITIDCDDDVPAVEIPEAFDNCADVVVTYVGEETLAGSCPQNYTIIRVFRAIDGCGNQAVESQTIVVRDITAPVFSQENQTTFTYECGAEIPAIEPSATDNCGTITYSFVDGEPTGTGCLQTIVRTWTAQDECGNSSTFVQTINLIDTTAPTVTGEIEISRPCDDMSGNYITVIETCNTYTVTKTDEYVSGGCAGTIIRTYIATDACGNASAPFTQFIHLTDETAPTASPANSTINVDCNAEVPAFTPQFSDNCDDDLDIVALPDSVIDGDCPSERTIIRRVKATDSCGNETTATQTVNVVDEAAPVWGTENQIEFVYECGSEAGVNQPVATDNCSEISYSHTDGATTEVECDQQFSRTWIATDACGNASAPFVQTIRFEDTVAPVINNCPSDIELGCEDSVPAPADVTATDSCDDDVAITYNEYVFGDQNEPGVLSNCDASTPVHASGGNCGVNIGGNDIDWAMQLNGMPLPYRFYSLSEGSLVRYENEIHFTATMNNVLDPTSGFFVDVTFEGGWDWTTWSTGLGYPTNYKADCVNVGNNYEQWLYYILSAEEGAELTGFGSYEGSSLNLSHAPSNNYYGFQYGNGGNNFNAAFGFGGWFSYTGVFQSSPTAAPAQQFGAGDFSLDLDCCPDYWIVRQWTATDCSGNSSTCSQIISYPGSTPDVTNTGSDVVEQFTEAREDARVTAGEVAVSPNPARDMALFNFKTVNNAATTLEIFDMSGRKVADVYSGTVEAGSAYQVSFDTEALATGIYMYRYTNGSDVQIKRLIINKQFQRTYMVKTLLGNEGGFLFDYGLQITDYGLRITDYGLRITD